jgi:hypothetical protein
VNARFKKILDKIAIIISKAEKKKGKYKDTEDMILRKGTSK